MAGMRGKIERNLANAPRDCDGQLAARVGIAEQHVGERRAAVLAGEPQLDDGGHMLHGPIHAERPAVAQHEGQRPARGVERLEQLLLVAGQVEADAAG